MPSAARNNDNSNMMRVNEVINTGIDGASDSAASNAINHLDDALVRPVGSSALLAHHVLPAGRPNKLAISCSRVS
jgi:hypothetical protein